MTVVIEENSLLSINRYITLSNVTYLFHGVGVEESTIEFVDSENHPALSSQSYNDSDFGPYYQPSLVFKNLSFTYETNGINDSAINNWTFVYNNNQFNTSFEMLNIKILNAKTKTSYNAWLQFGGIDHSHHFSEIVWKNVTFENIQDLLNQKKLCDIVYGDSVDISDLSINNLNDFCGIMHIEDVDNITLTNIVITNSFIGHDDCFYLKDTTNLIVDGFYFDNTFVYQDNILGINRVDYIQMYNIWFNNVSASTTLGSDYAATQMDRVDTVMVENFTITNVIDDTRGLTKYLN